MNVELPDDAIQFGSIVRRALTDAGGVNLAAEATALPSRRIEVESLLDNLGVFELAPHSDPVEAAAAATVVRECGRCCVPYPIANRLAGPAGPSANLVALIDPTLPYLDMADIGSWHVVDLEGNAFTIDDAVLAGDPRLGPFVHRVRIAETAPIDGNAVPWLLTFQGWWLVGAMQGAITETVRHVKVRIQFGNPLAAFQSVQFLLADATVATQAVDSLARYALWSCTIGHDAALVDAVALRVAALDAANQVFRICHQLHGAIGFCDETSISWLSRGSQPIRRLPIGASASQSWLTKLIAERGFAGLFDQKSAAQWGSDRG
jgi:3-oxo-4-pregnene-20-carboxyl-CoA dehydrogenase alpha subunit